jgi:outer membrane protein assembly factor BamB
MMKKILFSLLLAGCLHSQQQIDIPWPTLADSPWPMIAHDPQITGRSPYSGPKTTTIKWSLDLPYGVFSGPIIGEDGTLYVGTRSYLGFTGDSTNYFYAINSDGEIDWTFLTGTPSANESGYLVNYEGTIFFGSQSGRLYATSQDGNLKWKYDTGSSIHQRVMNIDLQGNIYIVNSTGYLYSFSKDGHLNWKNNYGNGLFPKSVAISPDGSTLYIVANDRSIYALNLDGSIKSVFQCVGISRQPLLIDNSGNLYFLPGCTPPGSIKSIDSTGQKRWEYVINNGDANFNESSPAMDFEGNIYFTYSIQIGDTDFSRIESVDYFGNFRWTYQFEQPREFIFMPLVVDKDGTIYCGSTEGYFYYSISNEGELLWKLPLDGYQVDNSGAIGSDGTLYIGTHLSSTSTGQENTLIAIRDTGTVSVDDDNVEIKDYVLSQNYPNPFNPSTTIKYQLANSGIVTLKVYDILGREVTTLVDGFKSEGSYEINFGAEGLSSGVYIYRITATNNGRILFADSKQMILLR